MSDDRAVATLRIVYKNLFDVTDPVARLAAAAEQIVKMRERLNQIFADQTGQPIETIAKDTDRNFWMTPEEAKEYGLVGKIIQSNDEL